MANGTLTERLKRAWNSFRSPSSHEDPYYDDRPSGWVSFNSSSSRPDRPRLTRGKERSIINSIYNRISMDVASLTYNHVRLDDENRFTEVIDSDLNWCLTMSANIDQTSRSFIQDAVFSMLDEGVIAIVPTDTTEDPNTTDSYDILSMRVGKIVTWYPDSVRVRLYNERTGNFEEITLKKTMVAIVENPFYSIMNSDNSTLRRLIRKLNLIDVVDENNASSKFNMIVQLPYVVRGEKRREEANRRQADIENQLSHSEYGIAYIDSAEKVTQLNRPLDNNLLNQVDYLTTQLYGQLGLTKAVMEGTADEKTNLNYVNTTIEPIASALVDEMNRKFLSRTALSQRQKIKFFRDPFRLVPINDLAEIADKFTRNEIMSSNEFRQVLGFKPSDDPAANELRNSNISRSNTQFADAPVQEEQQEEAAPDDQESEEVTGQNGEVRLRGLGNQE